MPKYLVTSSSHFEPLSYEDIIKPMAAYQERYDAAQDMYDALSMDTNALGRYISEDDEGDKRTRELYDNYQNKLNALMDDLYNNGYNANTKRNLSAARSAYASDIARISAAVQNRQQRSAEYNKLRRENPDLVMGYDPGLSGLDAYMDNDQYGNDWYQYSGGQFMKEVASDAQARATEMFRNTPQYTRQGVPEGYIKRIEQEGFTSDEVGRAYDYVYNLLTGNGETTKLTEPETILADVLMSHLNSTGAKRGDNLSDSEFDRLLEYGRAGLSSAIGKPKITEMDDKRWDYDRQVDLYNLKNPNPGDGSGGATPKPGDSYTINQLIQQRQTPGYEKLAKTMKRSFKGYKDGSSVLVNIPGGGERTYDSPWALANDVFNPIERQRARQAFGGLDIALSASDLQKKTTDNPINIDGTNYVVVKEDDDKVGFYYKDWNGGRHRNDQLSDIFNADRKFYQDNVKAWEEANPNMNIRDRIMTQKYGVVTPETEMKLRNQYNIPDNIDSQFVGDIVSTLDRVYDTSDAVLVGVEPGFDKAREVFGKTIISNLINANNLKKPETSRFAFHQMTNKGIDEKGNVDVKKIFGTDDAEKIWKSILSIEMSPESATQDRPNVILTIPTGKWTVDASILGTDLWNTLTQPIYGNGMNMTQAVDFMMKPLTDPVTALQMNDQESAIWTMSVLNILNDLESGELSYGPLISFDDEVYPLSPADIVTYPDIQDKLRNDIIRYMMLNLSIPQEEVSQNSVQYSGNTTSKPITLAGR